MDYSLDYIAIGSRIKGKRVEMNFTQEKLSEAVGIGVQHLSKIENGKAQLSLFCLVSLANALLTTTDYLLMDNLTATKQQRLQEIETFFDECSPVETFIIMKTAKTLKESIRQKQLFTKP